MTRKIILLSVGLASIAVFLQVGASSAPAATVKVEICHIPPRNTYNFHTIWVSEKALPAHLAHGDFEGACGDLCEQLCDDGNACTIDECDGAGGCVEDPAPADCDDESLCTDDSCDPLDGCVNEAVTCEPGSECDPDTGECEAGGGGSGGDSGGGGGSGGDSGGGGGSGGDNGGGGGSGGA